MRPDLEDYEELENATPRGFGMSWLVLGVALIGFGALAYYAYHSGDKTGAGGDVMLITADSAPIKEVPEDRGGEQFPNKDKTIYDVIAKEASEPTVEKLLPESEEPIIPMEELAEEDTASEEAPISEEAPASEEAAAPAEAKEAASHIPMPSAAAPELTPSQRATQEAKAKAAEEVAREVAEAAAERDAAAGIKPTEPAFVNVQTIAKGTKTVATPPKAALPPATKSGVLSLPASPKPTPMPAAKPVAAAAPKPVAAPVAMGGNYKIQLGSVRSDADARATWSKITTKHGDVVKGSPIIAQAVVNGATYYRIKASGFASAAAAKAACATLSARGQACIPAGQ